MPVVESKEAAKYTNDGSAQEHCGICEYFRRRTIPDSYHGWCQIVSGDIDYRGWCRHWVRKKEAA